MNKLEEKLIKEKCKDTLYGELLTAKLKELPCHHWSWAKHDIDNIMFKYMSIDWVPEKESQGLSSVINTIVQLSPSTLAVSHSLQHTHLQGSTYQFTLPRNQPADHNQLVGKFGMQSCFSKAEVPREPEESRTTTGYSTNNFRLKIKILKTV